MSVAPQATMPPPSRRSWWLRTLARAGVVGGVSGFAWHTEPSDLHLSLRVGLGLAILVGVGIGIWCDASRKQDLIDRLTGPCIAVVVSMVLCLVPIGTIEASPIGFGLVLGTLSGLVLTEATRRYRIAFPKATESSPLETIEH